MHIHDSRGLGLGVNQTVSDGPKLTIYGRSSVPTCRKDPPYPMEELVTLSKNALVCWHILEANLGCATVGWWLVNQT
jgi:hypothetical protein